MYVNSQGSGETYGGDVSSESIACTKYFNLASCRANLGTCSCIQKNKGADQPAHPRRPVSAFVYRSVDSILISKLASHRIPLF